MASTISISTTSTTSTKRASAARALASLVPLALACGPAGCSAAPTEASSTSAAASSALPIRGKWELASIQSFYYSYYAGSSVSDMHDVRASFAPGRGAVAEIDLDGDRNGTITALQSCRLEVPQKTDDGELGDPKGSPAALALIGIVSLAEDVSAIAESARCHAGEAEKKTVTVFPHGDGDQYFGANVGVEGDAESTAAADAECHALRGFRYVDVGGATACVGFADAAATRLEMIVQALDPISRSPDIHLSRLVMRRTDRDVESEPPTDNGGAGGSDVQCNVGAVQQHLGALEGCVASGGGAPCLTDDAGRYTDAAGDAVQLCGPRSGGGYSCSVDDLLACLAGGGGGGCFAPSAGHCQAIP